MSITASALFQTATAIAVLAGWWKVFEKAGRPGWHALIPLYNFVVFVEVVDRPLWWLAVLFFWPLLGLLIGPLALFAPLLVCTGLGFAAADRFHKDTWWALGLTFLPFLYYPMLGFSDAEYDDPDYRDIPDPEPEPVGLLAPRRPAVLPNNKGTANPSSVERSLEPSER